MRHGFDAIEHPFVHVDVDDLRAIDDLLFCTATASSNFPPRINLENFGRAGDVGAFADVNEICDSGATNSDSTRNSNAPLKSALQ